MQLRRIEIRDFRKITHRVIADLDDGLNIVVGDNEAGKSTMLAALRAVFFERHRVGGSTADGMQPYGGTLRPTVAVDFDLDGQAWSLVKSFCQRQEASLVGPGERLSGDAVEERLAALFGFSPPGRGGSNPRDHQGTHGLLWVEQGTRDDLGVGAGRNTLASALESEVGQVTGGDRGRALIAAAQGRRDRFWDKREKPRGELLAQQRLLEELRREQGDLEERRRTYDDKIVRLARVTEILDRHGRDDRLGRAVADVGRASRATAEAERQQAVLTEVAARRGEAERQLAEAVERHEGRDALRRRLVDTQADAERLAQEADEADAVSRRLEAAVREADGRLAGARAAADGAEQAVRTIEAAVRFRQNTAALAEQEQALAAAETLDARRRGAIARADAIRMDEKTVTVLVSLERAADKARIALEAASVQVLFEPSGDQTVMLDGIARAAGTALVITRDTAVELQGFGRIVLRPSGGTAPLARAVDGAERDLRDALRQAGVTSVGEARALLQQRTETLAEGASLGRTLAALVPGGLDALRQAVQSERAKLAAFAGKAGRPADEHADPLQADAARHRLDALRIAERQADAETRGALARSQAATAEAATAAERHAAGRRQVLLVSGELSTARARADDDELNERLIGARHRAEELRLGEESAAQVLARADIDTARLVLERAERAEREIRKDLGSLETERRDLQTELRAVGQDGIGERLAELDGAIEREDERLGGLAREAAASRLLHETLLAAQGEAKDRWLGPVRRRVEPYLRLIHPDTEIRMQHDTLEIDGLMRDGQFEAFSALSMGAREQVAVVTRLALADVLRAAGHPAAVILDDALVNTDEGRLDRMRNVLSRAARTLQILIFTCRERDFLGLGATHRL